MHAHRVHRLGAGALLYRVAHVTAAHSAQHRGGCAARALAHLVAHYRAQHATGQRAHARSGGCVLHGLHRFNAAANRTHRGPGHFMARIPPGGFVVPRLLRRLRVNAGGSPLHRRWGKRPACSVFRSCLRTLVKRYRPFFINDF